MTLLMQTILEDSILYFFVMAGFHIAMILFTAFRKVIKFHSLTERPRSDRNGIPGLRPQFPIGCDHDVRVLSLQLNRWLTRTFQFGTCDGFTFGNIPSKGR